MTKSLKVIGIAILATAGGVVAVGGLFVIGMWFTFEYYLPWLSRL